MVNERIIIKRITPGKCLLDGAGLQCRTTACSGYDQLQVIGSVAVGGTLNITLLSGFVPAAGNSFTLIANDAADPVTGTFAGLTEGSTVTISTTQFRLSYVGGDGNDVTLTALAGLPGLPQTGNAPIVSNDESLFLLFQS